MPVRGANGYAIQAGRSRRAGRDAMGRNSVASVIAKLEYENKQGQRQGDGVGDDDVATTQARGLDGAGPRAPAREWIWETANTVVRISPCGASA